MSVAKTRTHSRQVDDDPDDADRTQLSESELTRTRGCQLTFSPCAPIRNTYRTVATALSRVTGKTWQLQNSVCGEAIRTIGVN